MELNQSVQNATNARAGSAARQLIGPGAKTREVIRTQFCLLLLGLLWQCCARTLRQTHAVALRAVLLHAIVRQTVPGEMTFLEDSDV